MSLYSRGGNYRSKDANIERYERIKKKRYDKNLHATRENYKYKKVFVLQNNTHFISYNRYDRKYHLGSCGVSIYSSYYLGVVWRHFLKTF